MYQKMLSSDYGYPNLWKRGLIQEMVRLRANHRCEQCDIEFHFGTNLAVEASNYLGKPIIGTCHHIDMNKQNCSMRNIVYLCQRCHWMLHLLHWKPGMMIPLRWKDNIPKWIIERDLDYIPHKQQSLFGGES
ncbi:MAG: hypothetical protein AAF846_22330 [Chloroflexota bacterium]